VDVHRGYADRYTRPVAEKTSTNGTVPSGARRPHELAVLALPGVVLADMATPVEMFSLVRREDGSAPYRVKVCGSSRKLQLKHCSLETPYGLPALEKAQTIIVAGVTDVAAELPTAALSALRKAAQRGARVASICTGAFVLAAAGLLDGRRATTHWLVAPELAQRYPRVRVDPDVLYVDLGQILTSAGAAAGTDLCLHLIRKDCGAAVAARSARLAVMPLERDGGQAQFIHHALPAALTGSLAPLLAWASEHLKEDLGVESLARRQSTSVRTLHRLFAEQTGTTPAEWVMQRRVRRAQELLERTRKPVESVAAEAGFGSATALRERFRAVMGTSPLAYRKAFARKR
jgi:transcriptional regulator GlxA family with amidase domain